MSLAARGSTITIIIIAVIGREWKSIAAVVICSGDLLFTPSINAAERNRERLHERASDVVGRVPISLTHTRSLSITQITLARSPACSISSLRVFTSHCAARRRRREEEIRYVLERVQTSPGLTLLFSILRQN